MPAIRTLFTLAVALTLGLPQQPVTMRHVQPELFAATGSLVNALADIDRDGDVDLFVGFSGTYGNGAAPGPGFGQPLVGITNQLPARSIQFSIKVML